MNLKRRRAVQPRQPEKQNKKQKVKMKIPFTKMEGLGNDFIVVDESVKMNPDLARQMCDRRLGIGADQILWLRKSEAPGCDFRMDILNPDGSIAEMCGNGVRAAALYVSKHGKQK